jgi:hypothetical protein
MTKKNLSPRVKRAYLQARLYGEVELPTICLHLRSVINGSSDPVGRYALLRGLFFLNTVINTWEKGTGRVAADDMIDHGVWLMVAGVRSLLVIYLKEHS